MTENSTQQLVSSTQGFMSADESKRFEENFKKLEVLSQQLQNNQVSVDELIPRMKDAVGAIRVCKEVLQETKLRLKEMGEEFQELEQKVEFE